MRAYRSEWPTDFDDGYPEVTETTPGTGVRRIEQPGFGVEVLWNDPDKLLKPVVCVRAWRWVLQIGWLAG